MSIRKTNSQKLTHPKPIADDTAILYTKPVSLVETSSSILADGFFEKQESFPKHSHENGYYTLLLGGSHAEFAKTTENSPDLPGAVWWNEPGVTHKSSIGRKGVSFFCITIKQDNFESANQQFPIPEYFSTQGCEINWLAFRLYSEFKNWQICSPLIAEGIILEMLGLTARTNLKLEKLAPKWLTQVVEKLHDEFLEHPTTEELAHQANVHPVYLARVFRKFNDQTIGEYILNLRIRYAQGLLVNQEIPLVEIAISSGFSDQSHFTRTFKRFVGTTPGVFRKNLR